MRYEIKAVATPEMSAPETLRSDVLAQTDDLGEAKRLAGEYSWHPFGAAIVDTEARRIDWGNCITDFAGVVTY